MRRQNSDSRGSVSTHGDGKGMEKGRWGDCRLTDATSDSWDLKFNHSHALATPRLCVEMVGDDATLFGDYWRLPWR